MDCHDNHDALLTSRLIKKKFISENKSVACPSCEAKTDRVHYLYKDKIAEYPILKCQACSLLFMRPVITENLDDRKMDSVQDAELFGSSLLKRLHEKLIINREVRMARKIRGNGTLNLLDIGCGTGWITDIWRQHGFKVTGLEPSEKRSMIAREKYGIPVVNGFIEDFDPKEKYDVIILRHLVEHLEDPYRMLLKVRSLLSDDGIAIIVVPNINTIGRYIFETRWTWVIPHHVNFFNPLSFKKMLTRCEYRMITNYQTPSPLWYPESFMRLFPPDWSKNLYSYFRLFPLLLSVPLVLFGYVFGLSDNITGFVSKNDTKTCPDGSKEGQ